ncbi:MAG: helix-turn-helix transcriptional regulator [Acidobacteria bacterium]|nr:helix-turn-helix transcriptional regulator [Acidobacteriota bacterium]MBV9478772.1 helix-turn-helix transcriptional regulator [Acidobacteriota bacterium]
MPDAPDLAALAALLGDPARARMLTSLMRGTALTATELALDANIAPSTASAHLAKLAGAQVLAIEKQGRHRYFRLFDADVASLLEELMGLAAKRGAPVRRTGPADPALRAARVCYDHLAGERGVWLLDALRARKLLDGRDACSVSRDGEAFFARFGIDVDGLARSRRALCRPCLDWSERRQHLGGALGAAILARIFALRWARREPDSRAVTFTPHGERSLRALFEAA